MRLRARWSGPLRVSELLGRRAAWTKQTGCWWERDRGRLSRQGRERERRVGRGLQELERGSGGTDAQRGREHVQEGGKASGRRSERTEAGEPG